LKLYHTRKNLGKEDCLGNELLCTPDNNLCSLQLQYDVRVAKVIVDSVTLDQLCQPLACRHGTQSRFLL